MENYQIKFDLYCHSSIYNSLLGMPKKSPYLVCVEENRAQNVYVGLLSITKNKFLFCFMY